MWKIIPSLASKFVELHINPLKNLVSFLDPHWVFTNKSQPADTQATAWVGSWPDFWEQAQTPVNKLWEYISLAGRSPKIIPKVASISSLKQAQRRIFHLYGVLWKEICEWYRIALDDLGFLLILQLLL